MKEFLIRFFEGGLIISLCSYLITNANIKLAAILWSVPISMFIILYYMYQSGKSNVEISNFLQTTSYTVILTVLYLFILSKTIRYTNKLLYSIFIVSIIWLISIFIFYKLS